MDYEMGCIAGDQNVQPSRSWSISALRRDFHTASEDTEPEIDPTAQAAQISTQINKVHVVSMGLTTTRLLFPLDCATLNQHVRRVPGLDNIAHPSAAAAEWASYLT